MYLSLPISLSNANELDNPRYDQALATAKEAALRQSGYDADFKRMIKYGEDRTKKYFKDNSLEVVTILATTAYTSVYKKQMRFRYGPFTFTAKTNSVQALYTFQF